MTVKILLTERSSGSQKSKDDLRLQEIAFKIVKARKVIAVTGAGISCNAGIPVSTINRSIQATAKLTHST